MAELKTKKPSELKSKVSEEKNKWRVKLAGSDKVIKLFNTQKEAIEYVKNLTDNNERGFVVHSKKGKIRKI